MNKLFNIFSLDKSTQKTKKLETHLTKEDINIYPIFAHNDDITKYQNYSFPEEWRQFEEIAGSDAKKAYKKIINAIDHQVRGIIISNPNNIDRTLKDIMLDGIQIDFKCYSINSSKTFIYSFQFVVPFFLLDLFLVLSRVLILILLIPYFLFFIKQINLVI